MERSPVTESRKESQALSDVESRVSEALGRLIEFWGFKRNMGRIWGVLYLSKDPVSAESLRKRLGLSSGSVSMTLTELVRWGVVRKVWVQGERRDFYIAEVHLWRMISRVLGERERAEVVAVIEALEDSLKLIGTRRSPTSDVQRERVEQLLEFARMGQTLLDLLLSTAKLDIAPLARFVPRWVRSNS